jgi:hypothetical protein
VFRPTLAGGNSLFTLAIAAAITDSNEEKVTSLDDWIDEINVTLPE